MTYFSFNDMLKPSIYDLDDISELGETYLPFGNANPYDVIDWIINLNDEDFSLLMQTPIIVQAKIHYTKIRKANRE